jgi:hypothetical protein
VTESGEEEEGEVLDDKEESEATTHSDEEEEGEGEVIENNKATGHAKKKG